MKKMKLDLKKRYIQKIKDCRNENKRLSKLLNGLENRIEIDFLPQINSQHNIIADLQIRLGNQHRHLTAVDDEFEKTNLSYYKIVRAYRGLVIMQNDAKNMGIDVESIELPEKQPYKDFKMDSKVLESGKVVYTASMKAVKKPRKKKDKQ